MARDAKLGAAGIADSIVRRMAPLSPPEPGQAVLEIGCGTGPVTAAFGAHGLEPTGVEVVPEFVALARASFPDASFEVVEPTALPFPDGSFGTSSRCL